MIITSIEVQKKHKDRVNLYVDGEFFCGLSAETVMKYRLKDGMELDEKRLNYLKTETEKEVALKRALKYLERRQKTEKEVFDHLMQKGFDENIVSEVIAKLKNYKYIDDELYIKSYIKSKQKTSGKRKLFFDLKHKGLDENSVNQILDEMIDNQEDEILQLAKKYIKNKEKDTKTKQNLFRYLASKGFDMTEINSTIRNVFSHEFDESDDFFD